VKDRIKDRFYPADTWGTAPRVQGARGKALAGGVVAVKLNWQRAIKYKRHRKVPKNFYSK